MTVFFKTEVYKTEYMPVHALHALVNHTEWELRVEVSTTPGYDIDRRRFLVAKLKFLTWCTLFPESNTGRIEVDWAEFVDFITEEDESTDLAVNSHLYDLIPEYMQWLYKGNHWNEVPDYEVWDQYACI